MALITDKGELMIEGMNDNGQLLLPKQIAQQLSFFPEFMKMAFFADYKVQDVVFSGCVTQVICKDKHDATKMFAWGDNKFG